MKFVLALAVFSIAAQLAFADHSTEGMNAEMAKAMQLMQPGANHAILKDLTGKFKASSKFWMTPNSKAEEAKGTYNGKMIMDGRFLQTEYKSTAMGKPFNGMGLIGFDTVKEEYQSIWIDNMNTSLMTSTGKYDAASKMIAESGKASCPMTGEKEKVFRGEWKFVDKNTFIYTMYSNDKEGKEFKTMEITYKRG